MKLPKPTNAAALPILPFGTALTKVAVSGTSAASSAVSTDGVVRIACSCKFHYSINGDGTSASVNDPLLAADKFEFRAISTGDKVHAIQAAGESGGDLTIEFIG